MPTKRTWPGQRCTSCEEHGLPCGPNIHSRQSATTKLGNNSSLARQTRLRLGESQTRATRTNSVWDGLSDFDSACSLADLDLGWGQLLEESSNTLTKTSLPDVHIPETLSKTEVWPEVTMDLGHTDECSRESESTLLLNLSSSGDSLDIDRRFVAHESRIKLRH